MSDEISAIQAIMQWIEQNSQLSILIGSLISAVATIGGLSKLADYNINRRNRQHSNNLSYTNNDETSIRVNHSNRIPARNLAQLVNDNVGENEEFYITTKTSTLYDTNKGYVGTLTDGQLEMPFRYEFKGGFDEEDIASLMFNYAIDHNRPLVLQATLKYQQNSSKMVNIRQLKGMIGARIYMTKNFNDQNAPQLNDEIVV